MINDTHHDAIIIGAGAAGLSAGLVLARAQARVLLLDAGEPRNAPAAHMHGFVTRDGMPPADFLAEGRLEVTGYGAEISSDWVASVERVPAGGFAVTQVSGRIRNARALLVATGLWDELPDIPGLREGWGSWVHHCPYCHGYEVRSQAIVVIGTPARDMSIKQAGLLRRYSDRVSLVTNGIDLTPAERHRLDAFGVTVVDGVVGRVQHADADTTVVLSEGSTIAADAVFVAPHFRPTDELLHSLGCGVDPATGLIAVDATGRTSVPGVWAAGNVVTPTAQVITAAGAGSTSAITINGWLLEHDLDAAAAAY